MREIVYVVLAAGASQRMGFAKAVTPLGGKSPLERLGAVLEGRAVTIVAAEPLAPACSLAMPWASVLVNTRPFEGMSSSLLVAHRAIARGATLAVMLADKPFVQRQTLELCERALEVCAACDVLYPTAAGERGHPVYFGPAARARLAAIPSGDTLRAVRDDQRLSALAVECQDAGVLIDLDTPEAWQAAERRLQDESSVEREARRHA